MISVCPWPNVQMMMSVQKFSPRNGEVGVRKSFDILPLNLSQYCIIWVVKTGAIFQHSNFEMNRRIEWIVLILTHSHSHILIGCIWKLLSRLNSSSSACSQSQTARIFGRFLGESLKTQPGLTYMGNCLEFAERHREASEKLGCGTKHFSSTPRLQMDMATNTGSATDLDRKSWKRIPALCQSSAMDHNFAVLCAEWILLDISGSTKTKQAGDQLEVGL